VFLVLTICFPRALAVTDNSGGCSPVSSPGCTPSTSSVRSSREHAPAP